MSVRTTHDRAVCMYDSVTGLAFGPVFYSADELDDFLDSLDADPREYGSAELNDKYSQWKGDDQ